MQIFIKFESHLLKLPKQIFEQVGPNNCMSIVVHNRTASLQYNKKTLLQDSGPC